MNRDEVVAQERRQIELEARDVAGEVGSCRPRSRQVFVQLVKKVDNFRLVFRIVHYPDLAIFKEFHNRPQGCLVLPQGEDKNRRSVPLLGQGQPAEPAGLPANSNAKACTEDPPNLF